MVFSLFCPLIAQHSKVHRAGKNQFINWFFVQPRQERSKMTVQGCEKLAAEEFVTWSKQSSKSSTTEYLY